jgi:hypothetical protein
MQFVQASAEFLIFATNTTDVDLGLGLGAVASASWPREQQY